MKDEAKEELKRSDSRGSVKDVVSDVDSIDGTPQAKDVTSAGHWDNKNPSLSDSNYPQSTASTGEQAYRHYPDLTDTEADLETTQPGAHFKTRQGDIQVSMNTTPPPPLFRLSTPYSSRTGEKTYVGEGLFRRSPNAEGVDSPYAVPQEDQPRRSSVPPKHPTRVSTVYEEAPYRPESVSFAKRYDFPNPTSATPPEYSMRVPSEYQETPYKSEDVSFVKKYDSPDFTSSPQRTRFCFTEDNNMFYKSKTEANDDVLTFHQWQKQREKEERFQNWVHQMRSRALGYYATEFDERTFEMFADDSDNAEYKFYTEKNKLKRDKPRRRERLKK
jgi:hypothetical protein